MIFSYFLLTFVASWLHTYMKKQSQFSNMKNAVSHADIKAYGINTYFGGNENKACPEPVRLRSG
jgi:hypothetical protein